MYRPGDGTPTLPSGVTGNPVSAFILIAHLDSLHTPPAAASNCIAVLLLVGWSGVPSDFSSGFLYLGVGGAVVVGGGVVLY